MTEGHANQRFADRLTLYFDTFILSQNLTNDVKCQYL